MLLETERYQVGSDGCSPHWMLLEIERYTRLAAMDARLAPSDASRNRTLYQVGSDGCQAGPIGCF